METSPAYVPAQFVGEHPDLPDVARPARELFGIDSDLQVPAFPTRDEHAELSTIRSVMAGLPRA